MSKQHITWITTIIFNKTVNFNPWEIGFTDTTYRKIG